MACTPCKKTDSREVRRSPPIYITTVSVKDRIFFLRLLCRWSGSIWKMLWIDMVVFILLYICVNLLYHFALPSYPVQKRNFEKFVKHVQQIASGIPISFLLGFFVSAVFGRWWSVCMTIPWMSQASILLNCYICPPGKKELARKVRLNLLRYMNLAWILSMKLQSLQIFKRFQLAGEQQNDFEKLKMTMESFFLNPWFKVANGVESFRKSETDKSGDTCKILKRLEQINEDTHVKKTFGYLITKKEMGIFRNIAEEANDPNYQGDYWIPLQWCIRVLAKAKQAGIIIGEFEYSQLIKIVDSVRGGLGTLSLYSEINIPLVYTQVIVIGVYSYFLAEVFSSQLIKAGETTVATPKQNTTSDNFSQFDNYIPVFSIFKFIFFMGWFKTAASLLNPLGNDSHDLPTSLMLDYNLMISIQSGDAADEIYPETLGYEGDPESQLLSLEDLPDPSRMEELEIDDSPRGEPSEERHLKDEIA